jgi:Asp-tRNA(Asn)/Glu-tRNA(Gln) amidotransferase A subunit family amidase
MDDKVAAAMNAQIDYERECQRVEELRLKHAPDAAPWKPAAPNTPPVVRPGWLMKAQAAEMEVRKHEQAAAEAEQTRRSRHDVTRGEFEDLLALLGVTITSQSVVEARRREEARRHYDGVERRAKEREAREQALEPQRQRLMAEGRARDAAHYDAVAKRNAEREKAREAADAALRKQLSRTT